MIYLYRYDVPAFLDQAVIYAMLERTSPEKRHSFRRMGSSSHMLQSLCGDILVRAMACRALGKENHQLVFAKNPHGKPYLAGEEGFRFSVSHTGKIVVVGISDRELGVDVEGGRPATSRIIGRFFTEAEARFIREGEKEWEDRFFQVWTRKEAYIKWLGKGLAIPMQSFDVVTGPVTKLLHTQRGRDVIISCCAVEIEAPSLEIISETQFTAIQEELGPI